MLSEVLNGKVWLKAILERNQEQLGKAMDICADWADYHQLPWVM
jgi:hypothetical protein